MRTGTPHEAPAAVSADVGRLKAEVAYRSRLQGICHAVYRAENFDTLLIDLEKDMTRLFQAERVTVYGVDGVNRELVSRFKSGSEVREIRLPISKQSIAGYAALTHRQVNLADVQDKSERQRIDPALGFDGRWDARSGYVTRQVLACPIVFETYLLGVVQVINHLAGQRFSPADETAIAEIAGMLAVGFHTQRKILRARPRRFAFLLENHIISEDVLAKARVLAGGNGQSIERILIDKYNVKKDDIGRSLSQYFKVSYVDAKTSVMVPPLLLRGVKPGFMKRHLWVPWRVEKDTVDIALDDPGDQQRVDDIKPLFPGKKIRIHVALGDDIRKMIDRLSFRGAGTVAMDDILQRMNADQEEESVPAVFLGEQDSAVVQLVNKTLLDAIDKGASDVHIEPWPGGGRARIRLRIDGRCQEYNRIPSAYQQAVISRIKVMADLDIAERRRPQDGKIDFRKFGDRPVEIRVATIPTQGGGEDVVMRIVASGKPISLEKLYFSKSNFEKFKAVVQMPHGLVFVCGPTGSGKTTTLHAALQLLNTPERKIWTAEDPVEITQPGLRQVQVRPDLGFGFAESLRAFLRADPDVIMVGEMRDRETARMGIEASLTGHLVFSTLHTNSAPESITRLLDMGMDPFHFSDAMRCVLAQRLVPTLCECKAGYQPSGAECDILVREYGAAAAEARRDWPTRADLCLYRPVGCDRCRGSGYRGRMGIHELLLGSGAIKQMIQAKRPVHDIRHQAMAEGMTTLKQDGIEKILAGHCDLVQVRRVCIS